MGRDTRGPVELPAVSTPRRHRAAAARPTGKARSRRRTRSKGCRLRRAADPLDRDHHVLRHHGCGAEGAEPEQLAHHPVAAGKSREGRLVRHLVAEGAETIGEPSSALAMSLAARLGAMDVACRCAGNAYRCRSGAGDAQ
jgi:hypothetical protein